MRNWSASVAATATAAAVVVAAEEELDEWKVEEGGKGSVCCCFTRMFNIIRMTLRIEEGCECEHEYDECDCQVTMK